MTATPSLRRRATIATLGLFALLLVVVGVAVDAALGAQLRTELDTRLADRVERARAFSAAGFTADALPDLLGGQDIRVRVTAPDGRTYGDPGLPAPAPDAPASRGSVPEPGPDRGPDGGPGRAGTGRPDGGVTGTGGTGRPGPARDGTPGPPEGPAASSTTVTEVLDDGTRVLLVADTSQIDDVRGNLRLIMLLSGLTVLVLAAVALLAAVAGALRPLDRLTAMAGRITAGDRGRRLRPDRAGTELGRAAGAFDAMLDALESAEARANEAAGRARAAEERTRRFLSDAAHELRTPLAGMQAVAEQMAAHAEPADRRSTMLLRETARASRLVGDMLDLARIDGGVALAPAPADLAALADAEAERLRTLAPALTVVRTGTAAPATVDAGRVAQILANLGDNARRHTPPGGTITLDVAPGRVTVTDTGPGVPADQRDRIFERLVRLDDARDRESGGAGLGLSIARGLAGAHGGTLTCVPSPAGARFRLTLPRQ